MDAVSGPASIVPKKSVKRALRLHKLPEALSFLVPDVVLIRNLTVKLYPLPATALRPAPLYPSHLFRRLHDPPPLVPLPGFFQGVKNLFQTGLRLFGHLFLEGVDCLQFPTVKSVCLALICNRLHQVSHRRNRPQPAGFILGIVIIGHWRSPYKADCDAAKRWNEQFFKPLKAVCKNWKPRTVALIGNHSERIGRVLHARPELTGALGYVDLALSDYWDEVVHYVGTTPGIIEIQGILFAHYFVAGSFAKPKRPGCSNLIPGGA
jgi:hypothetical protein